MGARLSADEADFLEVFEVGADGFLIRLGKPRAQAAATVVEQFHRRERLAVQGAEKQGDALAFGFLQGLGKHQKRA